MSINFYGLGATALAVVTAPLWIPLGLYIGLTYHWEDTVPSDEDLDYGSDAHKEGSDVH